MNERELFMAALQIQDAGERSAYLDRASAGEPGVRRRVDALLAAFDRVGDFLEQPAGVPCATSGVSSPGPSNDSDPSVGPGTIIGSYKLLELIGEGGMGVVWTAQQQEPVRRLVAVKLIKAGIDSEEVLARFEAERQALALMDHPNIARVLGGGATAAGRPYLVMDLVKGVPITKFCDQHRYTLRQRLELFIPVCQAIQHAHQKGIIHRDLKPSNVLVALYDGKPVAKVIDFGVAKAAGQQLTEKTLVTGFGKIVGTLEYMSPEQAELNNLDIDTRSDVYSLGVLLYELLTGSPPFNRQELTRVGLLEMLRVIREQEPSKPSTKLSTAAGLPTLATSRGTDPFRLAKGVRGELDWIVMKALEKDRSRRYETASAFALDVQRHLEDGPVLACPPSVPYRLRKFARRNRTGIVIVGLAILFLLVTACGIGWVLRDRSARQSRTRAQVELILTEVDELGRAQNWAQALDVARRAEAAVATGTADSAIEWRVRELLKDLELIDRLERIRMDSATTVGGEFDLAGPDREYGQAFREYGLDLDVVPVQASIERLKARPGIAVALAAALDDWTRCRGRIRAGWKRLMTVARGIDPDPLRNRLRALMEEPPTTERDELSRLARIPDIQGEHPMTIRSLARALVKEKEVESAIRLLRDAQAAHPGDFWLNFLLGSALSEKHNWGEAIRFDTAAVAIRPDSAGALRNLGYDLRHRKRPDEALAAFRRANELDPACARGYRELGAVLIDLGKLDEAIDAYRRAIELDPKNVWGAIGLAHSGWSTVKLPDPPTGVVSRAVALTEQAIQIAAEEGRLWQYAGWVRYRAGDWKASIAALQKSCQLQEGGAGDCGQWIVLALAHARLAGQEDLPRGEREHHQAEARRHFEAANGQVKALSPTRPVEEIPRAIYDFRDEASRLIGAGAR